MPTSSITKKIVITDRDIADRLYRSMESPAPIYVKYRSIVMESRLGIRLLKNLTK